MPENNFGMRNYYLLIVLLLTVHHINAQHKLNGWVYNDGGEILSGASVRITNQSFSRQTTVNESGEYVFTDIVAGSYEITSSYQGKSVEYTVQIPEEKTFDIVFFTEQSGELDELTIQIESVKSQKEKEGFAMNVVETKEASLRNIQTNDLLDRTVGVRVRQNGGLGSGVNYNLNGMSGNAVRVMIDGVPLSVFGSSFNLSSIPPALIERIEVYKGVLPAHLSDDAMGGIINVVMKKGKYTNANASLSYGSFNTFQANLFGNYSDEKSGLTFRFSGFYNYSDNDYEIWGKFVKQTLPNGQIEENLRVKRFNDAYKSYGSRFELGFVDVKWADEFFINYNGSYSYNEIQHGLYMTRPYKGRFSESEANIVNVNYAKKDIFIKGLTFRTNNQFGKRKTVVNDTVSWAYNWYGEKVVGAKGDYLKTPDGAQQGAPTILHVNRNVLASRSQLGYEITDNHKVGVNYFLDKMERTDDDLMKTDLQRQFIPSGKNSKQILSAYYQARFFDSRLKTNVFYKYYQQKTTKIEPIVQQGVIVQNQYERDFNTNGYGFAGSYLITDAVALLFSAEKAVRMPTDSEIYGEPDLNIVSNFGLKPEESNNVNLGFKIGPYKINKHRFSLGATGFIRDTKDKIMRRATSNLNDAVEQAPFENLGKTKSQGFEVELKYDYNEKLFLIAQASKFDSRYNVKYDNNGNVLSNYNVQLPNEPYFNAHAGLQYAAGEIIQKESTLNIYYDFNFVDSFYGIWVPRVVKGVEAFEIPQQFVHNAGLSYTFPSKQFVLSFDVNNIFNAQAYDNFAVQKPGRAFYVKLNYSFFKL